MVKLLISDIGTQLNYFLNPHLDWDVNESFRQSYQKMQLLCLSIWAILTKVLHHLGMNPGHNKLQQNIRYGPDEKNTSIQD